MKTLNPKLVKALRDLRAAVTDPEIGKPMWDIITGLRGPDTGSAHDAAKDASTGVVRHTVFGSYEGRLPHSTGALASADREDLRKERMRSPYNAYGDAAFGGSWHFAHHAESAFSALGLDWTTINPDVVVTDDPTQGTPLAERIRADNVERKGK